MCNCEVNEYCGQGFDSPQLHQKKKEVKYMILKERVKDIEKCDYYGYTIVVDFISRDGVEYSEIDTLNDKMLSKYGNYEIVSEKFSLRDFYILRITSII